jgi:hypothetical protein
VYPCVDGAAASGSGTDKPSPSAEARCPTGIGAAPTQPSIADSTSGGDTHADGTTAVSRLRCELMLIASSQNVVGECRPREVHAVIPWRPTPVDPPVLMGRTGETHEGTRAPRRGASALFAAPGEPRVHRPLSADESLAELVRERGELARAHAAAVRGGRSMSRGVLHLSTKEAALRPGTGERSLNFGGRVKLGSVKNFQMEINSSSAAGGEGDASRAGAAAEAAARPRTTSTVVVGADGAQPLAFQFGKVGRDEFILDFRHPLSPVQAFALGLTALARKLSSQGG